MTFQSDPGLIRWNLHFRSAPEAVYERLTTDDGRARFWAESAVEQDGVIHFIFPNRAEWKGRILVQQLAEKFQVEYYGGSITTFELHSDGAGGTDLTLTDQGVSAEYRTEVIAGWVSVLMALKASLDFGSTCAIMIPDARGIMGLRKINDGNKIPLKPALRSENR